MLPFWNLQKNSDLFQNHQIYCHRITEISRMVYVRLQMNVMRDSEVKTNKDGRHLL